MLLVECSTMGWPFGGWALHDANGTVYGYHWFDPLDPLWCSTESAFAAFIPHQRQRDALRANGFKVARDHTDALLAPYLCSATTLDRHDCPASVSSDDDR